MFTVVGRGEKAVSLFSFFGVVFGFLTETFLSLDGSEVAVVFFTFSTIQKEING